MSALFLCFATLQLNDPDPMIWVFCYLFAFTTLWLPNNTRSTQAQSIVALAYLGSALYILTPHLAAFTLENEAVREGLGLAIVGIGIATLLFLRQKIDCKETAPNG